MIKEFQIIKIRWVFLIASALMIAASVAALLWWGLRVGVEFTGGSLLMFEFQEKVPLREDVLRALSDKDLGALGVQFTGDKGVLLRFRDVDETTHQDVVAALKGLAAGEEQQFSSIGPVVGEELKRKAAMAVGLAIVAIMLYIAWAFRKVSKPVPSWQYGFIVALVALVHDVIIPLGVFAALGHFFGIEVNVAFVAAILTILGFSVHDTIVVFDRTRENLRKIFEKDFSGIVNTSLNQTIGRSLATSMTVLLTIATIGVFGGEAVRDFAIALFIGIAVGTYSSIFVAGPLLIEFQRFRVPWRRRRRRS